MGWGEREKKDDHLGPPTTGTTGATGATAGATRLLTGATAGATGATAGEAGEEGGGMKKKEEKQLALTQ